MNTFVTKGCGQVLPPDFQDWPPHVQRLWTALLHHPSWTESGRVVATLDTLLARGAGTSRGALKRAFVWLRKRGWLARQWADAWVTVAGPREWARRGDVLPDLGDRPTDPGDRSSDPVDRLRRAIGDSQSRAKFSGSHASVPPPERPRASSPVAAFKDSCLSPSGRDKRPLKRAEVGAETGSAPPLSPERRAVASRLLGHYALACGLGHRYFRAASLGLVAVCLDDMEGDDAAKEPRVQAVIDDAIAESRRAGVTPSLGYVFNLKHFRRRLHRLAEAANTAHRGEDPFAAGFEAQLAEASAQLEAGELDVAADALDRARELHDRGRVTDAASLRRLEAVEARVRAGVRATVAEDLTAPRPAVEAPPAAPEESPAPSPAAPPRARSEVTSAAQALAVLRALYGDDDEAPPWPPYLDATAPANTHPALHAAARPPPSLDPDELALAHAAQEAARQRRGLAVA